MSYWEKTAQKMLDADRRIRYVGIVDKDFRVLHSQMRQGIESITPPETERNFVSIVPPVIVQGAEKLEPQCGLTRSLVIQYKKIVLTIHPIGKYIVMLSFDPSVEIPFVNMIDGLVRNVLKET